MNENTGNRFNRALIITGFLVQLVTSIYAYGRLTQAVDDIGHRLERVERWIDQKVK
jgi:hypothetical protein